MIPLTVSAQPGTRAVQPRPGGFLFECMCERVNTVDVHLGDGMDSAEITRACCLCTALHRFTVTREAS